MLKKIISGGQTGADQAALDLAIKFNLPHGGWIARGRKTESGPLPSKYLLQEMETPDYPSRTRQNILGSQATVILARGNLTRGSLLTRSFAKVMGKPLCHIDLAQRDPFEASMILHSFILENQIEILNVAGPRASNDPGIYFEVKSILEAVLYLLFLDSSREEEIRALMSWEPSGEDFPETLDQAVERIAGELPLKAKTFVARAKDDYVMALYFGWLDYLKIRLGFNSGNGPLLASLRQGMDPLEFTIEDGVMEIVKALKMYLQTHYRLKVVK